MERERAGHGLSCLGALQAEAGARQTLCGEDRLGAVTKREARAASAERPGGRVAESEFEIHRETGRPWDTPGGIRLCPMR